MMAEIEGVEPFTVAIRQAVLDDLHDRLDNLRWPAELAGVGWSRGVSVAYLADYWRDGYD